MRPASLVCRTVLGFVKPRSGQPSQHPFSYLHSIGKKSKGSGHMLCAHTRTRILSSGANYYGQETGYAMLQVSKKIK